MQREVGAADALAYDEPPAWYLFPRGSLRGALFRHGADTSLAAESL